MLLLNKAPAVQSLRILHAGIPAVLTATGFVIAILLCATTVRSEWSHLVTWYGIAFLLYLVVIFTAPRSSWRSATFWILTGLAARCLLIFTFPNLSDDIYRFIWDGHMWLNGINAFAASPNEIIATGQAYPGLTERLHAHLNSPGYYSIYPPVSQVIFVLGSWLGGNDWHISAIVLKTVIFLCECGTVRLMYLMSRSTAPRAAVLYALNPLVILELCGNVHFEALVIFALTLGYFHLRKSQIMSAGVAVAMAVGSKLVPVLSVPLLLRRLQWKQFWVFGMALTAVIAALFLPMLWGMPAENVGESLALYFRKFEFNASLYYLGRYIGFLLKGYNVIATLGPLMAVAGGLGILAYIITERRPSITNWPGGIVIVLTIYLAVTTTVHPWYVCTIFAMSVFSRLYFPLVWSGVVFLSYAAYQTPPYIENLWLIAIEYGAVAAAMIWDYSRMRNIAG